MAGPEVGENPDSTRDDNQDSWYLGMTAIALKR